MASLENRNGTYRLVFRFGNSKFSRSLRTKDKRTAEGCLARAEDNLRRVELGTLDVPDDCDLAAFLLSDGRANGKPKVLQLQTLAALLDGFLAGLPAGSLEDSTLALLQLHVRHLKRILGERCQIRTLRLVDLQSYVDQRSTEKGRRGKHVCATTIKKEIVTLNTAWRWAMHQGMVKQPLPKRGLRYAKTIEKPPFQTWEEVDRRVRRGGLTEGEQADLWDAVFLTLPEIRELLQHVQTTGLQPFIHPMFVFAAHTGARRSEMLRSQIDDIDLAAGMVTIRERKRVRATLTTRQVPLSPELAEVLTAWLEKHPGGNYTFCHNLNVSRSRKQRSTCGQLTRDEAHDHFKRTLASSQWAKLRGWHVFRHSFCSNCAAVGVDQRIINGWVGHQTEEMVRRYRHLIPNQQQEAIRSVFGLGK